MSIIIAILFKMVAIFLHLIRVEIQATLEEIILQGGFENGLYSFSST